MKQQGVATISFVLLAVGSASSQETNGTCFNADGCSPNNGQAALFQVKYSRERASELREASLINSSAVAVTHPLTNIDAGQAWVNDLDRHLKFECSSGEVISSMYSTHDNPTEDRKFKFLCAPLSSGSLRACSWTAYTVYDATWSIGDDDKVTTGIESVHDNSREDRRYKIKQCEVEGVVFKNANLDTNWRNEYDGVLNMNFPSSQFLTKIESRHDNAREDRQFKFGTVELDQSPTPTPEPTPAPTTAVTTAATTVAATTPAPAPTVAPVAAATPVAPSAAAAPTAAVKPSGAAAPLTQEGYAAVADCCCQAEMQQFVNRVAFELNLDVCNEGAIKGITPYHTCGLGPQSYDALTKDLFKATEDRCSGLKTAGACAPLPEDCPYFTSTDTVPDCQCSASKAAKLDFTRAYLTQNNLGGLGPDSGAQELHYTNIFGKPFPIRWTTHSNLCIDVEGGQNKNGANVALHPCVEDGTHFNMQWTLPPSGTGLIRWTPNPDKCWQVQDGSTALGANLILWTCDETQSAQQFTIPASGNGQIKWAKNPDRCVDVNAGGTATHTNIQMWICKAGNGNQLWTVPDVKDATDLVITTIGTLQGTANTEAAVAKANGFGSLVVRGETSADFKFSFVKSGTSTPRVLEEIHFSFVDIEKGSIGAEFVSARGHKGYVTDPDTTLMASLSPSGTKFTGTANVPPPTAPGLASDAQRKSSVMFIFKSTSEFNATLGNEGGPATEFAQLYFAGTTSILVDRCAE